MEIYYYLHCVFSKSKAKEKKAKAELDSLISDGYMEEKEVVDCAQNHNSVILVEIEQDDGYMETILVNNLGKVKQRCLFSLDQVNEARDKIRDVGHDKYFNKKQKKVVEEHLKGHEISYEEFIEEYLDEYLLDEYEQCKSRWINKIEDYYTEKK